MGGHGHSPFLPSFLFFSEILEQEATRLEAIAIRVEAITTSSKKLLGAPGLTTRSKDSTNGAPGIATLTTNVARSYWQHRRRSRRIRSSKPQRCAERTELLRPVSPSVCLSQETCFCLFQVSSNSRRPVSFTDGFAWHRY